MTEKTPKAATPAATAPTLADFEALRMELKRANSQYLNAAGYGASTLFDLVTMFESIRTLAGKDSQVGKLAGIGVYLAEDWGNSMDGMKEEAQAVLDAMEVKGGAA